MSSRYPLVTRPPLLADENPLVLTIRGAESADPIGDKAGNSAIGANAGKFGYGSSGNLGERSPLRYGGNSVSSKVAATLGFDPAGAAGAGGSAAKVALQDGDFAAASNGRGGGTGGKLRSVRRGNRKTPYDRPATGRHATAGGSTSMAAVSLSESKSTIATLKDSASRLLHSSASYLFSALFKRQPASITANGETPTAASIASKEEQIAATVEALAREENDKDDELVVPALEDGSENPMKPVNAEGSELGIEHVEEILKQRIWSREQVKRMTEIMNSRVSENDPAGLVSEAEKLEDQLEINAKVSSPVQVARAYMGDQSTRPSGIAASVRKSTLFSTEIQPSPGRMPVEDRYMSPFSRRWVRNHTSVRVPKRSLVLDDDLALSSPVRRVRQKTTLHTSYGPYSGATRRSIGSSKPLETRGLSPPSQSSQTALKILETLEKLSPSPGKFLEGPRSRELDKLSPINKGKFLNEPGGVVGTPASNQTPESSKSREKRIQNLETLMPPLKSSEAALGGIACADTKAAKNLGTEFSSTSRSLIPALAKGFRMTAVFEESNSDDEAKLQKTKSPPPSEASRVAPPSKGKEDAVITSGATTAVAALRESWQPDIPLAAPSYLKSNLIISSSTSKGKPSVTSSTHETTSNLTSYSSLSFPPVQRVEAKAPPPATSPSAADVTMPFEMVSSDMAKSPSLSVFAAAPHRPETRAVSTPVTLPLPPIASTVGIRESPEVQLATTSNLTTSRFSIAAPELKATARSTPAAVITQATPFLAMESVGPVSIPWSPATTIATGTDLSDAENAVTMATESPVSEKLVEVDTMATEAMAEEPVTTVVTSSSLGSASTASSTSSFSFGGSVQPMTFSFVPGVFTSSSPVVDFLHGVQSGMTSTSTSSTTQFTFGGAAFTGQTTASFSFGGQTVAPASSFAAPTFGVQSGTGTMGQLSSVGALPGAPFASSGNSSSPFAFGSSSTSNLFAFAASAPSGQSSASLFGAPSMASPFTSPATGNSSSTSAFSTTVAPASSTPPTFSLGASPSGPVSTGQSPFQFGAAAQANPFAANPFSSSSSAPAFGFGAPAITGTASSTLFGSIASSSTSMFSSSAGSTTTVNPFSFGSAGTSNSSPFGSGQSATAQAPVALARFTVGVQASAANPSGQPFAFGGQQPAAAPSLVGNPFSAAAAPPPVGNPFSATPAPPASGNPFSAGSAPAGNPFSAAGAAQSSSDFAAGFALGSSGGGDKSGRKFIKAKRIGGAKRSK